MSQKHLVFQWFWFEWSLFGNPWARKTWSKVRSSSTREDEEASKTDNLIDKGRKMGSRQNDHWTPRSSASQARGSRNFTPSKTSHFARGRFETMILTKIIFATRAWSGSEIVWAFKRENSFSMGLEYQDRSSSSLRRRISRVPKRAAARLNLIFDRNSSEDRRRRANIMEWGETKIIFSWGKNFSLLISNRTGIFPGSKYIIYFWAC